MAQKLLIIILIFFALSCNNRAKTNSASSIEKRDTARKTYPQNYIVKQGKDKKKSKNILIVAIDPHADGKLAVSKFDKVLQKYNCTVIGLTNVKNDQYNFITQINNDIKAAKNNLNLDVKKLFIAGFSGGARMAYMFATSHTNEVSGILMCGAGTNQKQTFPFPVAMIIGTKDFNFIEQYYSPYSMRVLNDNLLTIAFKGIHQWPSDDLILDAISFLFSKNNLNTDSVYIDLLKKARKYTKSKDYFLAFKYYEAAIKTCNNPEKKQIHSEFDKLLSNNDFNNYSVNFEKNLNIEIDRNNNLVKAIDDKDLQWWTHVIMMIDGSTKNKNEIIADSYSRTKAFLGILMFSACSREINNQYSTKIDKYLKIYELIEPKNDDLKKFKAIRKQQLGN